MALDFVASARDYVQITGLLGSPAALSMSIWFQVDALDTSGCDLMSIGDHATVRVHNDSSRMRCAWRGTGVWRSCYATVGNIIGDGLWHHIHFNLDPSSSLQTVWWDGVLKATTTYSDAIGWGTQGTNTFLGRHGNGSASYDFDGRSAAAAVWNTTLTSNERTALGLGVRPNRIRPSALILDMPLDGLGSTEPDLSGNAANGTVTGATRSNHPPISMLTRIDRATVPLIEAAAGGGLSIPVAMGNYRRRRAG